MLLMNPLQCGRRTYEGDTAKLDEISSKKLERSDGRWGDGSLVREVLSSLDCLISDLRPCAYRKQPPKNDMNSSYGRQQHFK